MNKPARYLEPDQPVWSQQASKSDLRLIQRVLANWQDWCLGDEFPRYADIAPDIFGEDWDYCFVLDRTQNFNSPIFDSIGDVLSRHTKSFLAGQTEWARGFLERANSHIAEVYERRDAVVVEAVVTRDDDRRLAFRCILLPLTADGVSISHVLGATNGKLL
jgi:hypothetical protein